MLGPIEGSAITMTTSLFFFIPLAPGGVAAAPVPPEKALILWTITIAFEQILPEGIIAWMSQQLQQRYGRARFGNMMENVS